MTFLPSMSCPDDRVQIAVAASPTGSPIEADAWKNLGNAIWSDAGSADT